MDTLPRVADSALQKANAGPQDFKEADLVALVAATLRDLHPASPGQPVVEPTSSLDRDLGFDSMGRMELLLRLEAAASITLPEDTLARAETVADLWLAVQRGRSRQPGDGPMPTRRAARPPAPEAVTALPSNDASQAESAPWTHARTLLEVLDAHLRVHPDRVQIVYLADDASTPLTYRQLSEGANAFAAGLQRAGLRPRQTVAIMLPTSPEYFFSYLGILRAGGIPVPIYPPARPSQLEDHVRRHTGILANAQVRLLVSVPEAMTVARLLQVRVPGLHAVVTPAQLAEAGGGEADAVKPEPVVVQADDVAFIQYTSGSTGQPKGVTLTHANLLANIRAMAQAVRATPDDVFVSWLPLYHDMGLIGAWLGGFTVGFRSVVMSPLAFLARPRRWLEVMTEHHGTLSAGPNFAYELCLAHIAGDALQGLDLSSWRLAFNGAEAVSPETVTRFSERFSACGLRQHAMTPVYGLAEASVGLLFPPLGRGPWVDCVVRADFERERRAVPVSADGAGALRFVACGRALPGHAVRIVNDAGQTLADRVEGRLEFRGPSATQGYWRAPELSLRLIHDGWLDTGDRAYAVAGEVFVTGRVKDIVIRGGRNLYPQEIEEAVGAVAGVRKGCVAVFGRADPRTGTERLVVLAETKLRQRTEQMTLREAIGRAVVEAIGEPPDEIVLAPPHTVLKTSSGKVRRSACRALLEQDLIGAAPVGVRQQWLRLAAGGLALRLRGAARVPTEVLWSLRAVLLFALFAPVSWWWAVSRTSADAAWAGCHRAARTLLQLLGTSVVVDGLERLPTERPVVVVCNHMSYLDGMVLVAALPHRHTFVAKRELQDQFVAGRFLTRLGAAFVERFDPRRSVADAQRMAESVTAEAPLLVFPEGTFVAEPGLLPFHLGAFLAAAQAGVAIVPITLTGTRRMLGAKRWWPRRALLALHVGQPIEMPVGVGLFAAAVQMRDAAATAIARRLAAEEA